MTAKRDTSQRALLSLLAVVCAVSIAAGCGSSRISADKKNAQQVAAAWLGESHGPPKVSCRGHVCEIDIRQPFIDASEAWLIAVPITTYYRGRDVSGVTRITLKITDTRRAKVALFSCRLSREPAGSHATDVRDAQKMCKGSVAPTSDS